MRAPLAVTMSILLAAPRAFAQDAGAPDAAAEIAALEDAIRKDAVTLASGNCVVACQALGSMARSVERLCALDPGPRCAAARAKVRDAERRVHAQCECKQANAEEHPPERASKQAGPEPSPPPASLREPSPAPPPARPPASPPAPSLASPPEPSAEVVTKRGGCAGCVVGGEEGAAGAGALAAFGLAALLRRRSRRR